MTPEKQEQLEDDARLRLQTGAPPRGPASSPEGLEIFYQPVWREWTFPGPDPAYEGRGTVLVIRRRETCASSPWIRALHPGERRIEVTLGSALRNLSPEAFEIDHRSQRDFAAVIDATKPLGAIYFLELTGAASGGEGSLEESLELGPMSLFRLVKAVGGLDAGAPIPLTVLTNGAYAVDASGRESLRPSAASLLGLAKVVARERAGLTVTCIDLGGEELRELGDGAPESLERILRCCHGGELAIRHGRAWRRILEPVGLAEPARRDLPIRRGGVYLILGGGGEIGFEVARQLASAFGAGVVLVGRRPGLEPERLRLLESRGGKAVYCQGDATDAESLQRAVRLAREKFGAIRGVLHAAAAGNSAPLAELDEAELRSGLAVKAQGSWNLYAATREEPLDFLVFFSSFQSLYGGHGAAIEAAGGAFEDTFAAALARAGASASRVRSIDWGPWAETRQMVEPEISGRLRDEGFYGLSVGEGLSAWIRVLAQPTQQVAAVRASSHAVQAMEWAPASERPLEPAAGGPFPARQVDEYLRGPAADEVHRLTRTSVVEAPFSGLDRLAEILLLHFLQSRGFLRAPGEEHSIVALEAELAIAERHQRLFWAMLHMLGQGGWIEVEKSGIRAAPQIDRDGVRDLGALISAEKRRLLAAYPSVEPHLRLLGTCVEWIGQILRDDVPATLVLFPDGSPALVEAVYNSSPGTAQSNRLIQMALGKIVESCLDHGQEPVRILEVGAGTGATTASLLPDLQPFANRVEYHYTDLSRRFLDHGETKFGARYPFLRFGLLNLELNPRQQGWAPGTFQAVVAVNVLHATADLSRTLRFLRHLLSPGGGLLIVEMTRASPFLTLTFGLLDGWWQHRDWSVRLPHSPLLSMRGWRALLDGEGFQSLSVLGFAQEGVAEPPMAVIFAGREEGESSSAGIS